MKKAQEAGIRIGKKKIWSISYADDVVIMADNATVLKEAISWFKKYIKKKGLDLNTLKTKILICRKGGGRKKKTPEFKWYDNSIEIVKKFN